MGLHRTGCERVPSGVHSLVQVGDLLAATLLDFTLATKLGQLCPFLRGVVVDPRAGGVGARRVIFDRTHVAPISVTSG